MLLILFRHGPAGEADPDVWPDDSKRALTSRGEERTRRAAAGLARLTEGTVRLILTSPYERCVRTAKIVSEVLGCRSVKELAELEPGGSFRQVIKAVPSVDDDEVVVLVGHEPDLGKLAGSLVFGTPTAMPLKKAGACAVLFDGPPATGKGQLEWHLPPRILRRLAGRRAGV